MAEMPTCKKCGLPHWRFDGCAEAAESAVKEADLARERERVKVRPEFKAPPGYVRVAENKFARAATTSSTHIQIAPGKFARRENYVVLPGGTYKRKEQ